MTSHIMTQALKQEEKVHRDSHRFNPYVLIHHYEDGKLVAREWRPETRYSRIDINPFTGQQLGHNPRTPDPLDHPRVRVDGSESLETILGDLYRSFCFTGVADDKHNDELYRGIFDTLLPSDTILCDYDGEVATEGCFRQEIVRPPRTYHDLFSILGLERQYGPIRYGRQELVNGCNPDGRIIYQYPDSVRLILTVDSNKLLMKYV